MTTRNNTVEKKQTLTLRKPNSSAARTKGLPLVGKVVVSLNTIQQFELLALMLYKLNGLDAEGKIRPLEEWV